MTRRHALITALLASSALLASCVRGQTGVSRLPSVTTTPPPFGVVPSAGPSLPPSQPEGPQPEIPTVVPSSGSGSGSSSNPLANLLTGSLKAPASLIANNGASLIANNGASLIANNGASLIANNGASLIANNGASLIANNGASYRLLDALGSEGGLANALVYLTNRDEKFYRNTTTGQVLTTSTDSTGAYRFDSSQPGFPLNGDVVVNAIANDNLRFTGYTVPTPSGVSLKIDFATTLATELYRRASQTAGAALGLNRAKFESAVAQTESALANGYISAVRTLRDANGNPATVPSSWTASHGGVLPDGMSGQPLKVGTFDFRIDHVDDLRNQYVAALCAVESASPAAFSAMKTLYQTWTVILGYAPTAVTTLFGDGQSPTEAERVANVLSGKTFEAPVRTPNGYTYGVAVARNGDIFTASYSGQSYGFIRRWIPLGNGKYQLQTVSTGAVNLITPMGLAIEYADQANAADKTPVALYVADQGQHQIYRVKLDGSGATLVAGSMAAVTGVDPFHSTWMPNDEGADPLTVHFDAPADVALDEKKNLYVADQRNHRIRMIVASGADGSYYKYKQPIDGNSDGVIDSFGLQAYLLAGKIYTIAGNPDWVPNINPGVNAGNIPLLPATGRATPDNGRHRWYGDFYSDNPDGTGMAQTAKFDQPVALAWRAGKLYVADFDNQRVRSLDRSTGEIATVAGAPTLPRNTTGTDHDFSPEFPVDTGTTLATATQLAYPRGLAFDTAGRLYIADERSGRIRMVDADGKISTVAGKLHDGVASPTDNATDGDALRWADLYDTQRIAVDPDGNVVLTDTRHLRVRKLWLQRAWQ